jgi:dihydropteroate synthase
MGILNVTPDSFSDGGRSLSAEDAVDAALRMMDEGADLIDVGGESTRPGAEPVSVDEETRRTAPVVEQLASRGIPVSIDTMKSVVAEKALDAGAFLVNDVSGLRDPEMVDLVQARGCHVCVMHMQGDPRTMQANPRYADVVGEVRDYLVHAAGMLKLPMEQIWIDPGIGFGKSSRHNLTILNHLDRLIETGYPVLIGVSRKSFIGKVLGGEEPLPPHDRLEGTHAVQVLAQLRGVRIIRAHDVRASRRAMDMLRAIRES